MERERSKTSFVMWTMLVALVSQNMVIPVMCRSLEGVGDEKTYYSHDPHSRSSPKTSPKCSPKSSPKSPSHGTPSHGSGGGGGGGGGSYGGHSSPVITPPSVTPSTPETPYVDPGTPDTPVTGTPYPPVTPDPNTPPVFTGTCDYWKSKPQLIWGLFGFWGTVAGVFGAACVPAYGQNLNLQQALTNTRSDGIGALYREGTASLLNSMVNRKFPFTTQQVKDKFALAIVSNKAASAQAELFKLANEGRFKPKA